MIVIVVIGILAAISIVAYNGITARSRDAERQSDMRNLKTAIESYYVDNGRYPGCNGSTNVPAACTTDGLSVALVPKYLKAMDNDPINIPATNAYWYALGFKKNGPMTHGLTSSTQDYSIGTYMEAKGCPCTGAWGSQVNFMEGN